MSGSSARSSIVELILEAVDATARSLARWAQADSSPFATLGFGAFIVPQMNEEERTDFRSAIEVMYDAEPDRSAARAKLLFDFPPWCLGRGEHV